jgi:hypothetical protein
VALRHDGESTRLSVRVSDPVRADAACVKALTLRAVLFGAREGDEVAASLNGVALPLAMRDPAWQDPQILSPAPQPASGGSGRYAVDPAQKLLRLEFTVAPGLCRLGPNQVAVRLCDRAPYVATEVMLEKLEVHLAYR